MTADDEALAAAFVDTARYLNAAHHAAVAEDRVTETAVRTVEGCESAGITVVRRGSRFVTVSATDELPAQVDRLQYELGEGPCVDATRENAVHLTVDLSLDTRWPRFGPAAVEQTTVRSMLSVQLFVEEDVLGALNLYARRPDAFDDHAVAVSAILAGHAALAVRAAQVRDRAERLEDAVVSNREIGVAVGVLMARRQLTQEQAFGELRRASQWLNVRLRDVAAEVTETGQLPTDARRLGS